jgi:hypothetical protein
MESTVLPVCGKLQTLFLLDAEKKSRAPVRVPIPLLRENAAEGKKAGMRRLQLACD